jgi:hypothetical protein
MAPQKCPYTPLPEPGRYNGRTDEQEVQESRNNPPSLRRNEWTLENLYRPPLHPESGRGTQRRSPAEQDIFLADTLSDALQLALLCEDYFGEDSTNHNIPTMTGRHHGHVSTQQDLEEDSGDIPPRQ